MIELKNVTKIFNRGTINENVAIKGLSLKIDQYDFITVIGSNGAGKSTLLNLISGNLIPEYGEIFINDKNVTNLPVYVRASFIGQVFQDPLSGTAASLTIEENLAIALKRGKKRGLGLGVKRTDREFFKEQLSKLGLGLENRLKDRVGLLSGGQRQAVTLLMATLVKPEILLLDEHTAALDPKTAAKIIELTEYFVDEYKLTVLMVTHNMRQALSLGNRTIMMHEGEIILDVRSPERDTLQVKDLLEMFARVRGEELVDDKLLLA
ncbi:ABC transporter ATP-binding protein [Calditerrivibrio nitroreducens]|uniref:ABC transporter related protein n=1 Tax=Calditerrivibrio nitroreducens (strain DSM 19672 / NBRC 101217 / Yu37-1) TaxID=768670 RepID=E4TEW7_CALNY|nr:ABC transporter ATP-binding protein [Calditerrivibrio nitroreducens]ADR18373.1 ABC transporter related protein [Calditerrivibrio nitroreducens DSM 19672]